MFLHCFTILNFITTEESGNMEDQKVFASCHNHSCFSDAAYTPEKLAQLAHSMGHGGIILTDHDTVRGTYFINKEVRKLGLKNILEGRGVRRIPDA
jgi:DNA polymerase III alpha subunit (gram-positive type)